MKIKTRFESPPIRLILADSSVQHLQVLRGYLELTGGRFEVVGCFCQGRELLAWLAAGGRADLIITDYFLCDMDAAELYGRLRDMHPEPLPRMLCAVEMRNTWQRENLLSLGLERYIIKPYHMEALFALAGEMFEQPGSPAADAAARLLADIGLTEQRRAPCAYTCQALCWVLDSSSAHPIAKEIYYQVAAQELVTASAVESALRRAAAQAFDYRTEQYSALCRQADKPLDRPLSNGEFLEMLLLELRRRT